MTGRLFPVLAAALLAATPAAALAGWRQGPGLEAPAAALAAAQTGGKVYVSGGAGLLSPQAGFAAYDPETGAWEELPPLPQALERHGMAALDGAVYVAGGYAPGVETPGSGLWIYDIASEVWRPGPAMPTARADFSLVTLDGRLYAAGAGRLIAFDPQDGLWLDLGPDPMTGRRGAAAAALDGKLYLIGGAAPARRAAGDAENDGAPQLELTGRVDIYDPQTGVWTSGPELPAPARAGHAAVTLQGRLHVFGGRAPGAQAAALDTHLVLESTADGARWREAAKLPAPRSAAAAAALPDGSVMLAGGGVGGGFFAPFTALDAVDFFTE